MAIEAEAEVTWTQRMPTASGRWKRQRRDAPPDPPGGVEPCSLLDFRLQASRNGRG